MLIVLLGLPRPILAHPTHAGTLISHIKPDEGRVEVLLSIIHDDLGRTLRLDTDGNNIVDTAELQAGEARILDYLDQHLALSADGAPCTRQERKLVQIETGDALAKLHTYFDYTCPQPITSVSYTLTALFEDDGGYRHYGRVQVGERITPASFNREFPTTTIEVAPRPAAAAASTDSAATTPPEPAPTTASTGQTMLFYTWEGILHILSGFDHVLFVICLLLVARHFKGLAGVITSFTVGHSVTLILSALDVVTVSPHITEPLIALSIIYVAVEDVLKPQEEPRYRFLITAAFGLIHGFGFSYVLRDDVGLPTDALLPALLSFNVGVELGQLAIVAACYPLLRLMMDKTWYRYVVWGGGGSVAVLAGWWFVDRAFLS